MNDYNAKILLNKIQDLQSAGGNIYPKGLFPSQRYHPFLPYLREDDNLFFTASIVHILHSLKNDFNDEETALTNEIIEKAKTSYPLFKNKDGLDTYNFWQTKPSRHFPNGLFMHRFKHFQIPDDIDDTALVFLTEKADKKRVSILREKLKRHANLSYKRAFNPQEKYRDLKCYSTFFGKNMYIEFDICALSNLMRAILPHFKEDLNEYDTDTLHFITESVLNDEHLKLPFYSAPNYPTSELILYHLARLIPHLPEKYKKKLQPKVVKDLQTHIIDSHGMNRILLENTLLKLGQPFESEVPDMESISEDDNFFFFHAGMITAFENTLAQKMANGSAFHLRYRCQALNWAFILENLILKRGLTR